MIIWRQFAHLRERTFWTLLNELSLQRGMVEVSESAR
jgi:hypothetical protein